MLRWGVIGCGGIAYRRTIPGLVKAENSKLVAGNGYVDIPEIVLLGTEYLNVAHLAPPLP